MISQPLTWSISWTDGWVYEPHELEVGVLSSFFHLTLPSPPQTPQEQVHAKVKKELSNNILLTQRGGTLHQMPQIHLYAVLSCVGGRLPDALLLQAFIPRIARAIVQEDGFCAGKRGEKFVVRQSILRSFCCMHY